MNEMRQQLPQLGLLREKCLGERGWECPNLCLKQARMNTISHDMQWWMQRRLGLTNFLNLKKVSSSLPNIWKMMRWIVKLPQLRLHNILFEWRIGELPHFYLWILRMHNWMDWKNCPIYEFYGVYGVCRWNEIWGVAPNLDFRTKPYFDERKGICPNLWFYACNE